MIRKLASIGWMAILPVLLLTVWWVWSTGSGSLYFPPLPEILVHTWNTWTGEAFVTHVLPSLRNLVLGYVIGAGLAIACGVVIGLVRPLRWLLLPLIDYARGLPPPAMLPFFLLVLGIGTAMQVGVIAFGIFVVMLLNTIDGVREVEPLLREVSRVYRVRLRHRLFRVILPGASPQIVAGLRNCVSLALVLMIISEMVASTEGIGYFTTRAQQTYAYLDMWAGMLLLGLLGVVLNFLFTLAERRVLHWQIGANKTSGAA